MNQEFIGHVRKTGSQHTKRNVTRSLFDIIKKVRLLMDYRLHMKGKTKKI